ncbi:FecCD family ABC transporter permease [Listeria monocytogenes]|uniref:Iron ABC transporter permease n=5 Tax=Listeria monocytogenes TaxID=1639 RepID=S5KV40_LISMN|nr:MULTISPECIES: iron ABC transporter permease [Listeria]EAD3235741.1 iron ABC transporter permease [Listeria monocytogenes CFSAN002202]EAD5038631.1 iron ABC transporter permease [Listeria monocytogenes serotype 1/2a]EAE1680913.1 iron ABC transporter permease [Listeria monocytogenes LIS0071]EAE3706780.1 iron ABC transporter permease [Listeria monocytogenes serotype 1/2b]EAE6021631.1 iron ABC transporter permease [Listeria monocytogenes serotype 3a]EAG6254117.1 iron ABC transporter permease [L
MTTVKAHDPRRKRRRITFIVVIILLILAFFYGLTTGSVKITYSDAWQTLTGGGSDLANQLIWNLRLPRLLIAFLVGAALAIAGCLLQGVMRNPLADPGVIGVSAGGGFVAILMTLAFPALASFVPIGAFLGAFGTAILIYLLAWDRGVSPLRVILSGVAINAFIGAMTSGVMVLYSNRVQSVISWMTGTLSGKSWYHLDMIWPYMLVGFVLSGFAIRSSNVLLLGDDAAKLLGFSVERHRFFIIMLAAFLSGVAVSVAGLIGFVGLVVPHIFRLIIGNDYKYLLPLSALGGALLVGFADTAARSWFGSIELPVGILLAMIGAPFFLFLLQRGRVAS